MGQVCGWTEKTQIKSLETVGVVRDNAETAEAHDWPLRFAEGFLPLRYLDTGTRAAVCSGHRRSEICDFHLAERFPIREVSHAIRPDDLAVGGEAGYQGRRTAHFGTRSESLPVLRAGWSGQFRERFSDVGGFRGAAGAQGQEG